MAKSRSRRGGKKRRESKATAPSRPTVKRLFAVSGNRCVFPRCKTPIVDPKSGSVLGEICHIKGEKPGAKRYDRSQSDSQRHQFDNLILACARHHKIIDDDDQTYTVEKLLAMKARHEQSQTSRRTVTDRVASQLIAKYRAIQIHCGSVITSQGQSGGQVAHTIQNVYRQKSTSDGRVIIEGKLHTDGDLALIQRFGTPGVRVTLVSRGKRPAKIVKAQLCVRGRGFMKALQKGFDSDFGHKPFAGREKETLYVDLLALSSKNSEEGFVLQRDDVCRFFLPLGPGIGPCLEAQAKDVFIRVKFFDGSRKTILRGAEVQDVVRGTVDMYKRCNFHLTAEMKCGIEVDAASLPELDPSLIGKVNPKRVWLGAAAEPAERPESVKLEIELGFGAIRNQWALIVQLNGVPVEAQNHLHMYFCFAEPHSEPVGIALVRMQSKPDESRLCFMLPGEARGKVLAVADPTAADRWWISLICRNVEMQRITGDELKPVVDAWRALVDPPSTASGNPPNEQREGGAVAEGA